MSKAFKRGRNATYGMLAAVTLALGAIAPAHAAGQPGETVVSASASAKVSATSLKVKQRLSGTATITYKAYVLGIPAWLTAAHINSIPLTFTKAQVDATKNAAQSAKKYVKKQDAWLGVKQWVAAGDTAFVGDVTVVVRGSATAATKGKKHFHAGTGDGHFVDSNATKLITVK